MKDEISINADSRPHRYLLRCCGSISHENGCVKVSSTRKQILKFSVEPKIEQNVFVFLPLLSKMDQIKKRMQNITLDDK